MISYVEWIVTYQKKICRMDCNTELQFLSIVVYSNHVHTTILQEVSALYFHDLFSVSVV